MADTPELTKKNAVKILVTRAAKLRLVSFTNKILLVPRPGQLGLSPDESLHVQIKFDARAAFRLDIAHFHFAQLPLTIDFFEFARLEFFEQLAFGVVSFGKNDGGSAALAAFMPYPGNHFRISVRRGL